jgi:hypothetical protein
MVQSAPTMPSDGWSACILDAFVLHLEGSGDDHFMPGGTQLVTAHVLREIKDRGKWFIHVTDFPHIHVHMIRLQTSLHSLG